MKDETKEQLNTRYQRELQRGERFWPDSIFKDVIVSWVSSFCCCCWPPSLGLRRKPRRTQVTPHTYLGPNGISSSCSSSSRYTARFQYLARSSGSRLF